MRSEPIKSSPIVTTIPYGATVSMEQVDDAWAKVEYKGKVGYAMIKFLSTDKSSGISKTDLQRIYDSLKNTLKLIEEVLK